MKFLSFLYLLLIFLCIGTSPISAQSGKNGNADTLVLDEITIAVTKFIDNKLKIPNQVQIIGQREISLQNTQTAADLLANSGAAFVQKSQGGGGSPILRGFEANKVLIVVDDVRMNNAIFRGGHLQNILRVDNNLLERAEIVYGTGSLVYGSDALGGVMHFRTLSPKLSSTDQLQTSGAAMLRYGSVNNEMAGHARINLGGAKWASLTGITFTQYGDLRQGGSNNPFCDTCALLWQRPFYVETTNGVDSIVANENPLVQTPTGYNQLNVLQKLRYQANENVSHTLSFQYSNTNDIPRYDRLTDLAGGTLRNAEWYYGPETWVSTSYQLKSTNANALYNEGAITVAYQLFKESRNSRRVNRPQTKHQYETLNAITLNADAAKYVGKQRLQYGIEAVYNTVGSEANLSTVADPSATLEPADTRYPSGGSTVWNMSAYLADRWAISNNFDLGAGLRFNYASLKSVFDDKTFFNFPFDVAEQRNNALVGNLSAVYHTQNGFKAGATVSTGYRTPNVDDMAKVFESVVGSGGEGGTLIVPNPDLSPEKTANYDLNIEKRLSEHGRVFLSGFYTQLSDALVFAKTTFNGQDSVLYDGSMTAVYSTQNRDKAEIYGISGGASVEFAKHWLLSAQASYTVGNIIAEDDTKSPLDHIAPLFGRLGLLYQKSGGLNAELYSLFNGAKSIDRYRLDGEDNLNYATPNGLPAWFTINLKASYPIGKRLEVQTGIENILDTNYRVFASGISSAGRNFLVALRANF